MNTLSDMAAKWIAAAPTEALHAKLDEYAVDRADLSPRDTEARAALRAGLRAELARRREEGRA